MDTAPFERLQREMTGYMRTSVLAALAELDLATLILQQGNSLSAAKAAQLNACDEHGMEVLLDALAALGYLRKSGSGDHALFSVPEEFQACLDSRHPATYIPMMRHMANGQRTWARLSWTVKDGCPQARQPSLLGMEQDRISFIMAMNSLAVRLVPATMDALRAAGLLSFSKTEVHILDIGGASGTYTEAFLQALPGSRATIFDLPVGIGQARQRFAGSALEARVGLVEGDFLRDALPGGFDLAWISAIIHQMDRDDSRLLYRKALKALCPGGRVAVRDFVMDESRTCPVDGALFGINMLVNTEAGRVYTYGEIREDLEAAGFVDVAHAVDVPSMSAVVSARRPA